MDIFTIIAGIIIAISFFGFIYYCAKGGNLLLGLFVTTLIWTTISVLNTVINAAPGDSIWNLVVADLSTVFHDGPVEYGQTTAIIIFASWFGRVLVDTGIARSLIKRVVELAGDKQLSLVLIVSLVNAALFMSIFGPGSVIAMGSIILPIYFSIGINKQLAIGSFVMSVAAGMYVNGGYVSQFSGHAFFQPLFDNDINGFNAKFNSFTWAATIVHLIVLVAFVIFSYNKTKNKVRTWKAMDGGSGTSDANKDVAAYTFIVPFVPVILSLVVNLANIWHGNLSSFSVIFNFIVGVFLGLLLTGNLSTYSRAVEMTQKTLHNGISDVALLIGMLLTLNMFSKSASLISPIISTLLGSSLNWIGDNPLIIVVIFMILAPLALFRGPFMIWGSGIALASVVSAVLTAGDASLTGTFPLLLVLFYVQPVGMVANSCPTQSWNLWALSYGKFEPREFIKSNVLWSWAIVAINIFLAYYFIVAQ